MLSLRLTSFAIAAFICIGLGVIALTSRFDAMMEMFNDQDAVKVEIEEKEKPKPPPPPPPNRPPPPPPPEQRVPPPDLSSPPTPTPIPVAVDPPPAPPTPQLTGIRWLEQPDGDDYARYYPDRASSRDQEGRATIDCLVGGDGRISCTVVSEDPAGWGFGEASLRVARHFRVAPQTQDGQQTTGGRFRRTIRWQLPE
jgi:periplasmic protein TonB